MNRTDPTGTQPATRPFRADPVRSERPLPTAGATRSFRSTASSRRPRLRVLGVEIDKLDLATALEAILAPRGVEARCRIVNFANAHCLNVACGDAAYRAALAASDLVLADGSGVALAGRLRGQPVRANLNGTDLFPLLCERARDLGLSIYLLGARPGVAAAAGRHMQETYPGLIVAGARDGYFEPDDAAHVIDDINRSRADLVFVALGVPLQELWIGRSAGLLAQARCVLGVGGLFDFYSGRIPRAPAALRRLGLEWTWRLLLEPRRMWRRYVAGNPLFVLRVWRESRRLGRRPALPDAWARPRRVRAALRRWCAARRPALRGRATRATDVAVSALALVAMAPLMLLIAALISLESPGPILFAQTRVGRDGRPFRFLKFRSMYVDAEARRDALEQSNEMAGGVLFKMRHDPRVTRAGRVLRRYSLDELPQLINVVRGDMSLVGPRPALPGEVARYSSGDRRRLCGQPGITCIWQVSGRSEIPFRKQVEMDLTYLHDATLARNLKLLLKTVPAVLGGRGAY